jgi:Golgi phosphoprotein 3 (GPP34)
MSLIAEDLLLLMLDDRKGTVVGTSHLQTALGGAVLIELATTGAVTVEEKTSMWKSAKVRANPEVALDDDLLRRAAGVVAEKERSAQDLVGRLGKGLKDDLTGRLEQRGILERREQKVLGLFPRTRWPAADSSHEDAVRRDLAAALVQGVQPEQRTACLIALLSAIDRAHKVVDRDGLPAGQVRKRAKEIANGEWAAKAVKDAIAASTAAVTAAVTAATTGAAVSGS